MKLSTLLPLPVLTAIYPVFALYVFNADQVGLSEIWRAVAVAGLVGAVILGYCRIAFRRADKAAIVGTALVGALFGLGHLANVASELFGSGVVLALIGLEVAVLLGMVIGVSRAEEDLSWILNGLYRLVAMLFASALLTLGARSLLLLGASPPPERLPAPIVSSPARRPDIYYIVLDGYGRADLLEEYLGFDNAPFAEALRQRGFVLPPRSRSNYGQTVLSLASSLNFELLDPEAVSAGGASDFGVVISMVKDNRAMEYLAERGYLVATVPSGFPGTDPMPQASVSWGERVKAFNGFERTLLQNTVNWMALSVILNKYLFRVHRETILAELEGLRTFGIQPSDRPRFLFVHVLAPHPPFVFDEQGRLPPQDLSFSPLDGRPFHGRRSLYQERYAAQVRFLNARVLEAIDAILEGIDPERRPIVILQGDHGPASHHDPEGRDPDYLRERMGILNAWYVPPDIEIALHDTISPVNAFRVVFNAVFDAGLPLLPDRALFSTYERPFAFREVDEQGGAIDPSEGGLGG